MNQSSPSEAMTFLNEKVYLEEPPWPAPNPVVYFFGSYPSLGQHLSLRTELVKALL